MPRPKDATGWQQCLIEAESRDFPNERVILCLNKRLRIERARKREELLWQTEQALQRIADAVDKGSMAGAGRIGKRVGAEATLWKMPRHFELDIEPRRLRWQWLEQNIRAEASLDGVHAVRTSLPDIAAHQAVHACKSLSRIEQAFRSARPVLNIRPVHVYTADHVRGHVFLCMLACYLQWHLRKRLAPLLFEYDDRLSADGRSPVDRAEVSDRAKSKSATRKTEEGHAVHSFRSLLDHLATLTLNQVSLPGRHAIALPIVANPTALQSRAFELLDLDPNRLVPST